jgi:putative hemolysin
MLGPDRSGIDIDRPAAKKVVHYVGAGAQPVVSFRLFWPTRPNDTLVHGFATADRNPTQPSGVHFRERSDEMSEDNGMVAPAAGYCEAAKGYRRGCECRAYPSPIVAGIALPLAPRRNVIGSHCRIQTDPLSGAHESSNSLGANCSCKAW